MGASGNLAQSKLIPLILKNKFYLNQEFILFSRNIPENNLMKQIKEIKSDNLKIVKGSYTNIDDIKKLINDKNLIIHLCLPSQINIHVLNVLNKLNKKIIICLEKPYFFDQNDFLEAKKLKNLKIQFIDHFLLKNTITYFQNHRNKFLNKKNIKSIKLIAKESILAQNRIAFDHDGIIKDMITSHLFAIYDLILENNGIKNLKLKNVVTKGQYSNYEFQSKTPTFAHLIFESSYGHSVDFISGKGLEEKKTQIIINFHNNKNSLILDIYPQERIIDNQEIIQIKNEIDGYDKLYNDIICDNYCLSVNHESVIFVFKVWSEIDKFEREMVFYERNAKFGDY